MLAMAFNPGEEVVIGDKHGNVIARVTYVQALGGQKIRLGIEADKSIAIDRAKIWNDKIANGQYR